MNGPFIFPTRAREVAEARLDMREIMGSAAMDDVVSLEAKVTDLVRHQPIGVVLLALAMALGRASAERFGPLTTRPFALIAAAVQLTWREAACQSTKH
jgi:hypothetical protein